MRVQSLLKHVGYFLRLLGLGILGFVAAIAGLIYCAYQIVRFTFNAYR